MRCHPIGKETHNWDIRAQVQRYDGPCGSAKIRRYVRFDSFEDYLFVALRCPWRDGGRSEGIQDSGCLPEFLAWFQRKGPS